MPEITMKYNGKNVGALDLKSVEFEWIGKLNSGTPSKGDWKITTKSNSGQTMVFWSVPTLHTRQLMNAT